MTNTDKQIIIDGVDVSGCKYYDNLDCYAERGCCGYPLDCEDNPNCYYKQLKRKEQECAQFRNANDEKNELLAKLGCPTTATAKRNVLCLQQQIDKLKEDNEELRKNILLKCPNCGEEYLSPEGAALYEENTNLKERIKGEIHLVNNYKEDFAKQFKQAEKYKQTLTEIKEIVRKHYKTEEELFKIRHSRLPKFSMGALNGRHNLALEILQKIKEVINESNI